jgi:tRNA-specific 2-thiouridylase
MSGGVDSSVAAALLQQQGYDCIGVFMRLGSPGETLDELIPGDDACTTRIGKQGCCSINDAADARLVAAQLGIPFYVVNFKREFGRIIDYFVDEYAAGRTPNPCVRCNDWLKFGKLHDYAQQIGADYVASGHYARVEATQRRSDAATKGGMLAALSKHAFAAKPPETPRLLRGLDHSKDQSYVLFGVPRDHLARMLLPIGAFHKADIRVMARDLGLPVFDKPDSQEICFVPDNDYAALVERRRPGVVKPGAVLDESGEHVGDHEGQHRFTIGQRRGVGVALGRPLYVVEKDVRANTVTLGPRHALLVRTCIVHEANWLIDAPAPGVWLAALGRYRSNGHLVPVRVRVLGATPPGPSGRAGAFEVEFADPQEAVAPGQALVLYDADTPDAVAGGGWIASAAR